MNKTRIGILLCILAFLGASILSGFVKAASNAGLATQEILFFQSVVALVILIPWIFKSGVKNLVPKNKVLIICRSLTGIMFMYLFYLSIRFVPLVNAMLLRNTSPLFIPVLILLFFRKKISMQVTVTMIIGFTGVVLVLNPGRGFLRPGDIIALSSGFMAALGTILLKRLEDRGETIPVIMLFYLIITMVVMGIWSITVWKTPHGILWLYLVFTGILYAAYQILFLLALKHASPVVVAPFIYFGVVFAGIVDWIGWQQMPSHMAIIGSGVVITGAVLSTIHHSRKQ